MKEKLNKLGAFIIRNMDDVLIFCGLGAITGATFMINVIAGTYVLGACLIFAGWLIMLATQKKKKTSSPVFAAQKNAKNRR